MLETPESRTAADEAWRRWLTEFPAVRPLLPAIVAQISKRRDLEATFEERLHQSKLDALKEFAYGAGHELNNPLANIASRAQTLLSEENNPERRRRLAAINTQAFRAHEMLADMMLFARPPELELREVNLVQLIADVLRELAEDAAAQQTTMNGPTRCDALTISADPVQLGVALRVLCINSLEALGEGGHINVEICLGDAESGSAGGNEISDVVQIVVTDDGPGIPAEIREKIFDPFFSGREAGRGLGFGLSKCWRIVTLHGGTIAVQSDAGRGASIALTLPTNRPVARSASTNSPF
jgi:signal transduction histidine kinase